MAAPACAACGAPLPPNVAACPRCGVPVPVTAPAADAGAPPAPPYPYPYPPPPYGPYPYPLPYGPYPYPPPYGAYPYPPPYGLPPSGTAYPPGPKPPYGAPPIYAAPPGYPPFMILPPTPEMRMSSIALSARNAREGAAVLDLMIMMSEWALLFFIIYPAIFGNGFGFGPFGFFAARGLEYRIPMTAAIALLYYGLQDGAGGTVGKRAMRLRVVDIDGQTIGPLGGIARASELLFWAGCNLVPVFGLVGFGILQYVLVSKNGQGVGDRFASAYVVSRDALPAR